MKEICFANFFPVSFFLAILFVSSFFFLPATVSAGSISLPPNNLGLVAYYSFEDATGTKATDFSGNGNAGTLTNMTDADWVNGKIGKALDFDGTDGLIEVADSNNWNFGTGAFSISTWVRWDTLATSVLIGTNTSSSAEKTPGWYLLYNNSSHVLAFDSYNGGWQTAVSGSFTPSVGTWYYVVVKRESGGALSILVNGVSISGASTDASDIQSGDYPLSIGGINGTSAPSFMNGSLDDVRIYSRALSATEITNLYNRSNKIIKAKTGISNNGLVGYWSFEDATGTKATDFSGNGNVGTLTNMDANTDWVNGKIGKSLDFDGTNDFVAIPDSSVYSYTTESFSISLWAKSSACGAAGPILVKDRTADGNKPAYLIYFGDSLSFGVSDSNNWPTWVSATYTCSASVWRHVVAVQDRTNGVATLYVDGVSAGTDATPGNSYDSTGNLHIAKRIDGSESNGGDQTEYYSGFVDEVRIYNRVLSTAEISALYNSTKSTKVNSSQNNKLTNGLVGLWSFDGKDISGTTAYDRSGNNNNGTLTNSPTPTAGKIGQGMSFDGTDDYISISNSNAFDFGTGDFSVSTWMKTTSSSAGTTFVRYNTSGGSGQVAMFYSWAPFGTGKVGLYTWNASSEEVYRGTSSTVNDGNWHHIVAIRSGGTISIYVDGVLNQGTQTGSATVNVSSDAGVYIGANDNPPGPVANYLNGSLDDFRFYNRALSTTEVQMLYNMGR